MGWRVAAIIPFWTNVLLGLFILVLLPTRKQTLFSFIISLLYCLLNKTHSEEERETITSVTLLTANTVPLEYVNQMIFSSILCLAALAVKQIKNAD